MNAEELELLALAERVEKFDCNITCPLCGETDFDVPGFVFSHSNWCKVQLACCEVMAKNDAEVVACLRARAAGEAALALAAGEAA